MGDTALRRVVPILMGAHKPEYTLEHVMQAVEANITMVRMCKHGYASNEDCMIAGASGSSGMLHMR